MTLYQYRIVHLPFPPTHEGNENYLNVIGQQGWELVSACAFDHRIRVKTKIEHRVEQVCYFRRPFVLEETGIQGTTENVSTGN